LVLPCVTDTVPSNQQLSSPAPVGNKSRSRPTSSPRQRDCHFSPELQAPPPEFFTRSSLRLPRPRFTTAKGGCSLMPSATKGSNSCPPPFAGLKNSQPHAVVGLGSTRCSVIGAFPAAARDANPAIRHARSAFMPSNAHGEQPRRANASRRSAQLCCWAAIAVQQLGRQSRI